jgi:hypothetical protein
MCSDDRLKVTKSLTEAQQLQEDELGRRGIAAMTAAVCESGNPPAMTRKAKMRHNRKSHYR